MEFRDINPPFVTSHALDHTDGIECSMVCYIYGGGVMEKDESSYKYTYSKHSILLIWTLVYCADVCEDNALNRFHFKLRNN